MKHHRFKNTDPLRNHSPKHGNIWKATISKTNKNHFAASRLRRPSLNFSALEGSRKGQGAAMKKQPSKMYPRPPVTNLRSFFRNKNVDVGVRFFDWQLVWICSELASYSTILSSSCQVSFHSCGLSMPVSTR